MVKNVTHVPKKIIKPRNVFFAENASNFFCGKSCKLLKKIEKLKEKNATFAIHAQYVQLPVPYLNDEMPSPQSTKYSVVTN